MEWEWWSFKLREVTFSSPSRHKVMVLIYWTRLWRLLLSLAYSSYRPYRCCVLSKNVSQLLFQLLSWSEDNTKALVRFFGSAHQRYDYTWFIVLIVVVFLIICKTRWKATSTLKRISIILKWFETQFSTHRMLPHQLTESEFNRWFTLVLPKRYWRPEKILTFLCGKDNLKLLFCFGSLACVCFTWVKTPILALLLTSLVKLGTYRKNKKKRWGLEVV